MKKYLIRRLLIVIPVLIGISMIIFGLVHNTPGNPYSHMIDPNMTAENRESMLESIGYYDPLPVKYVKWASRAATLDLGYSTRYKEPVTDVIGRRIQNTLLLSISAFIFSTIIAIPLGVISATKQYSIFDYLATIIAFVGLSIPAFFFGLLLIKFLAFDLGLFPVAGMQTSGSGLSGIGLMLNVAHHMILPVIVLSLLSTASLMRYTRSSMLEVIKQDYIRTARAKGLSERVVIYKHALRNALIPVVTVLSMTIPFLFSGAILTETIFVWPGVGTLALNAVLNRDYPIIMGTTMLIAVATLLANLFADIMYAVIDPRIRYN